MKMKTASFLTLVLLCTGLTSCKVESEKANIPPEPVESVAGWDKYSIKMKRDEERKTTESTKKNDLLKYYESAPIPEEVVQKGFVLEHGLSPDLVGSKKFNLVQNQAEEVYYFYYNREGGLEIVTESTTNLVIPVAVTYTESDDNKIGRNEYILFYKYHVNDTSWQTNKIKKSDLEKVKVK
jgi:hypothetical protein